LALELSDLFGRETHDDIISPDSHICYRTPSYARISIAASRTQAQVGHVVALLHSEIAILPDNITGGKGTFANGSDRERCLENRGMQF